MGRRSMEVVTFIELCGRGIVKRAAKMGLGVVASAGWVAVAP